MGEENYTPWPAEPPEAKILWLDDEHAAEGWPEGHLHWYDPDGHRAAIPVTKTDADTMAGQPVWHVDLEHVDGQPFAVISPSVHFEGHWHSGNPVRFRLVDELTPP